ncbi:ATP-binding SpoIIE family protein phosphatase [Streptomyces asiaticus]|uniref:ATP-binding SpoIIE family protein phosphatase n=1 Tax=Streptomyces asiaticus TaxID=114695 RepID=UPI00381B9838
MPPAAGNGEPYRSPPSPPSDAAAFEALLADALRQAILDLDSITGIVYLMEENGEWLRAAMIGGTPPAIFAMPERMTLDAPYASSTACRTGTVMVFGEPVVRADDPGLARVVPFPYAVASTPLHAHGSRFGALTLIRIPSRVGLMSDEKRQRLRGIGDRLARNLAPLTEHCLPLPNTATPVLLPVFSSDSRQPCGQTTVWGVSDAPGSSGMTLMYQLHKLSAALNQATETHDVVVAARSRLMHPYRAQSLILNIVSDGRLWVAGHCGIASHHLRQFHGSSSDSPTPVADAVHGRDPLLFPDRARLLAAYPGAPDDGQRAWAFLPLRSSGNPVGVCCLGFAEERVFEPEEQAVMMMMADLLGQALDRARLSEREHALAESLQRGLLPRILRDLPEMITTARYLPARPTVGAGGDWYDGITLPDGRICLMVGDVEGHGVESSAVMGQLRSAVLAYARENHGPAAILTRTSQLLAELDTELLATCCCVRMDVADGSAEVALAGHPAPLVRRPDGHVDTLDAPADVPLGVHSATPYRAYETTLTPGSMLLLYTDGLTPRQSSEAVAGVRTLLAAGSRDNERNLEGLADRLIASTPKPPERHDDAVLLLARYERATLDSHHRISRMEIQRHDLQGVRATRAFMRDNLRSWGRDAMTDDLELMASEVVTNALIHADSDVELRLREYPDHVRLEVRDSDVSPPVPSSLSTVEEENAQAEHGRGLIIVDGLATAWGSSPSGRGKTVWLELSTRDGA